MPRSALTSAASSSSNEASSSLGERVTMRLISWTSLLCVLARPALNLSKNPMKVRPSLFGGGGGDGHAFCPMLLHFLDVFVRQFDRANQRFALAETMAVTAAGHEQIVFVGNFQVAFGHGGGMFSMETFNSIQTSGDQGGNDAVG